MGIVFLNVDTVDVLEMLLGGEDFLLLGSGIVLLLSSLSSIFLDLFGSETWESLLVMWDVEATVASSLHGTEDTVTSGSADETDIEVSLEWSSLSHMVLDGVESTINLIVTLVHVSHLLGLEESSGGEETGGVGGGVVGETTVEAISSELLRVSRCDGHISLDGRVDDGAQNSAVGSSDDESVLLGVVLVLVVDDESLTCVVVSLSLSSSAEFGLVALRVSFVLQNLDVAHCRVVFNNPH